MSMTPRLNCPNARYGEGMVIQCAKADDLCAHQRYCMSKGWYVLTDQAGNCPARKEKGNNVPRQNDKASKKRRDKV